MVFFRVFHIVRGNYYVARMSSCSKTVRSTDEDSGACPTGEFRSKFKVTDDRTENGVFTITVFGRVRYGEFL